MRLPCAGNSGTGISTGSIYNKSDADGDNWVDIPNTRTNDAAGDIRFQVTCGSAWDSVIIAQKLFNNSTAANLFNPHFNPTDHDDGLSITTADTAAPADIRFSITTTIGNQVTPYWTIAAADLPAYHGSYDVYIKAYAGSSETVTAQFYNSAVGNGATKKTLSNSSTDNLVYLGNHSLPGLEYSPFESVNASINIGIYLDYVTGATVECFGLWLVPTDIAPAFVSTEFSVTASANAIIVDGVTETVYEIDTSSGDMEFNARPHMAGRYLKSTGGQVNRFYFYIWEGTDFQHNDSITGDTFFWVFDRFLGLRGNT